MKSFFSLTFILVICLFTQASEGALSGVFSVSSTKKIVFSKGDLQYQTSTKTWRFAANQYDRIGSNYSSRSSTYSGWIDMFAWGTSGWSSGAVAYQPYTKTTKDSDFYPE